jgi:hypothetical protein
MSAISIGGGGCGAAISRVAAEWLGLAAAPTFGTMALLTAVLGSGPEPLCSVEHGSLMSGMVSMYLLMAVFHVAPWLRLIARRRS